LKKGKVIVLNGASSSGKTVIAEALQEVLDEPYLRVSIDGFVDMLPRRYVDGEGLSEAELNELRGLVPRMVTGFHRCIGALSSAGVNVIVDHVLQDPSWLRECVEGLAGHPVLFVGVQCPLQELERREREREREPGTARRQYEVVHAHGDYDLEIDTSVLDPMECAERIRGALGSIDSVGAFDRLRARLGRRRPA